MSPSLLMNTMHGRDRNVYIEYRKFLRDTRRYNNSDFSWVLNRQGGGPNGGNITQRPSASQAESLTRRNLVQRAQRTAAKAGRRIFIAPPTPEVFQQAPGRTQPGRAGPDFDVGRKYMIEKKRSFRQLRVTAPQDFSRQDDKEAVHIARWSAICGFSGQRVEELQRRWFGAAEQGTKVSQDLKFVNRITTACRIPKEAKDMIEDMFNFCVRLSHLREHNSHGQVRIDFEDMIRMLGIFQMATHWRADQYEEVPDQEPYTLDKYRRDEISKGKLLSAMKNKMCVFFFEEDIKDLIVGQQRAKLALIDQMISSLEEGHVEEEEETSIGDGGIPTSDGAAVAGVMMGFLGNIGAKKSTKKSALCTSIEQGMQKMMAREASRAEFAAGKPAAAATSD